MISTVTLAAVGLALVACTPAPQPTVTVTQPGPTVTVTWTVHSATSTPPPAPTTPGPTPTGTPTEMGVIELKVGESKQIPIRSLNASARRWDKLTTPGDAAVAKAEIKTGDMPKGCNPGGCEQPQTLVVTGVAPGETRVAVAYFQFQTPPSDPRAWKIVVR